MPVSIQIHGNTIFTHRIFGKPAISLNKWKPYIITVFLAAFVLFATCAAAGELFISEYVEGTGNNKAIEIYNDTGATVDLDAGAYVVQIYFDGAATPSAPISLTGTVADGDVYVLAHPSADAAITGVADQLYGGTWFDGNDAVVFRRNGGSGTILDSIGQVGFDPGTEWGTGDASTRDNTIQKMAMYCVGDKDPTDVYDPSIVWNGFATDTFGGLGAHVADCSSVMVVKTDALAIDTNGDGYPGPGDTIRYTVIITNTGTIDALNIEFTDDVDPYTTIVPGSINMSPIVYAGAVTTTEDIPVTINLTGLDAEGSALTFFPETAPANGALSGVTPINGTTSQIDYTPNPDYTGADLFTYKANDGAANSTNAAIINITILPVNDPPEINLDPDNSGGNSPNFTTIYNETTPPILIGDTDLSVFDVDNTTLATATATIINPLDGANEVLSATAGATGIGVTYVNPTLTLNGPAVYTDFQTVMRTLTYFNASATPVTTTARLVIFKATDGTDVSTPVTATVNVVEYDNPPVLTNIEATPQNYVENTPPVNITASVLITDIDSPNIFSATVRITGNYQNGEDVLSATAGVPAGITASPFDSGTGMIELTGPASFADFETALYAITFENTSDFPSTLDRTISFKASDGNSSSIPVTRTITITPINDPPELGGIETAPQTFIENSPPVIITSSILLTDVDSLDFDTGVLTVDITANGTLSDQLSIHDSGTIGVGIEVVGLNVYYNGTQIGTYSIGTGAAPLTVTMNPSSSQAAVLELMRNITFENQSDTPSTLVRTVAFQITDGDGGTSNVVSRDIAVLSVGDPPELNNIEPTVRNYIENSPPITITSTISVNDPDSVNVLSATIQIVTNYDNGADVLSDNGSVPVGITVNAFDAGTGTLLLTGANTLANYQTALRAITFVNTSDNPSALNRTIRFIISDGTSLSAPADRTLSVTPINDDPVLAGIEGTVASFTEAGPPVTITASHNVDRLRFAGLQRRYANGYNHRKRHRERPLVRNKQRRHYGRRFHNQLFRFGNRNIHRRNE